MKFGEVASEYDRRLDAIYNTYAEAVRALKAARKRKDAAIRELDAWLDKAYDSPKEGAGV